MYGGPAGAYAQTEGGPDWSSIAREDLTAIHDILAANAAFTATDRDSAAMRAWLERGLAQARRGASFARSERSYKMVLATYVSGFRDPHIGLLPSPAQVRESPLQWPGIATRWRDGRYEVAYVASEVAADAPPVGAVLQGCDGRSANALARARLGWLGDPSDPWSRFWLGPLLLWDWGEPGQTRPAECSFTIDRLRRRWRLRWIDPVPTAIVSARAAGSYAPEARFGLARWGRDAWWIGIPDMTSGGEWGSLYRSIDSNLSRLREARLLVIDIRGNRGGRSEYGDRLVRQLWGESLATSRRLPEGRVSYRTGRLVRLWIAANDPQLLASFDRAAGAGARSFTVEDPSLLTPPRTVNPMRARVLVLADYSCSSSCLMLLDQLLRFPNVEQAGTETASDTIFGELTEAMLPSGRSRIVFPIKAWIDRARRSHQSLRPRAALGWHGDLRDAAGLRAWLWRASTFRGAQD